MYGLTVLLYADAPKKLPRVLRSLLEQKASEQNGKRLQLIVLDAAGGEAKAVVQAVERAVPRHPAVDVSCESAEGLTAAEGYAKYLSLVKGEAVCLSSCRVCYTGALLADVTELLETQPALSVLQVRELQAEGRRMPLICFETAYEGQVNRPGLPERYIYRTEVLQALSADQLAALPVGVTEETPWLLPSCACVHLRDCLFTVVLYADDEERLEPAVKELMEQKDLSRYGCFCDNHTVQVLVLDPHCSELTEQACQRLRQRYRHIQRIPAEDLPDYAAYNKALPRVRGLYVTFTAASARYTGNVFSVVEQLFVSQPISLLALRACYRTEEGTLKNYAAMPHKGSGRVKLSLRPFSAHLHFNAYFIEAALLKNRRFDEACGSDSPLKLLLELLLETDGYYYLKQQQYIYSVPREDNTSTFMQQHEASWYTEAVRRFLLPLLVQNEKEGMPAPDFLQVVCLYLLFARYNCNLNERTKGALEPDKLDEFFAVSGELLAHISDAFITQKKETPQKYPRPLVFFWLRLRARAMGKELAVLSGRQGFYYSFTEETACKRTDELRRISAGTAEQLIISTMNYENGTLFLDAKLSAPDFCAEEQARLLVRLNGRPVPVTPTRTYALISCFGRVISDRAIYRIALPVEELTRGTVTFEMETAGGTFPLRLLFRTAYSRLSNLPGSYWCYRPDRVLTYAENALYIQPASKRSKRRREREFLKESYRKGRKRRYILKSVAVRSLYWLTRPFFRRKRIWVTFDKLYKAGDNGEYMYRYIAAQKDDVTPYYIIKKDSLDYPRLKKDGVRLLKFHTLRCLLTCLNAEVVLDTHANASSYCGFTARAYPYFRDLFTPEMICIQHGLTTQSIAQFQNRLFDNLKLYCCASPKEIENLMQPIYGYEPSQLKLTGLARYDGLINNDRKNILITPTWRRNLVNANVAHMQKKHSEFFRNSEYFRIYDRLIHDEELIACARECGYSITYLLHPGMSAQLDDFDNTGYVDVVAAYGDVNYEKILTEASLMVTDYSGVQFDFAYMRKPIVYYLPSTLPPHYEESDAFRCEVDGFGPIVDHHEQLVRELCEYMRNSCRMKEEYVARADRFFAFSDHENCRRIYEAARAYMDGKRRETK